MMNKTTKTKNLIYYPFSNHILNLSKVKMAKLITHLLVVAMAISFVFGQNQEISGYRAKRISETEIEAGNGDPETACSEMRSERACCACCNNLHFETAIFRDNHCVCPQNSPQTHDMAEHPVVDLKKLFEMAGLKV